MSQPDTVMKAARQLFREGHRIITLEEIVVRAWTLDKGTFGLGGGFKEEYPDANKVMTSIVGKKGLVAKGRLVKLRPKLYTVPEQEIKDHGEERPEKSGGADGSPLHPENAQGHEVAIQGLLLPTGDQHDGRDRRADAIDAQGRGRLVQADEVLRPDAPYGVTS